MTAEVSHIFPPSPRKTKLTMKYVMTEHKITGNVDGGGPNVRLDNVFV